jgi:histidinol-phosphate aminotransferase
MKKRIPKQPSATERLIRPLVRNLHPYTPGEQTQVAGLVKLNTNENPYPPAPAVLKAVKAAVDRRLRLYPEPTASALRQRLAKLHRCQPENIIVGNGSDELLALATRAFVEPAESTRLTAQGVSQSTVQYFDPGYSLYPVLAAIHGARHNAVPLHGDFELPTLSRLRRSVQWDFRAALSFLTTPNAPAGRGYSTADLDTLASLHKGVLILDEAYADFADENAMSLALKHPHVIVSRTFSKAYSLCFQRVGYFVGPVELIDALHRIRDSYNVNGLGQVAAEATLDHLDYYQANFKKIVATRKQTADALVGLGFDVFPSQTNFLLVRPPRFPAEAWMEQLRKRKVLVRWFDAPTVRAYLRITIGMPDQMEKLLAAAKAIADSEV